MMNIYNHPQAIYHRFTYYYKTEFHNKDHIFNNWFISKLPQFSVNKVYENDYIQEKNLSEKRTK